MPPAPPAAAGTVVTDADRDARRAWLDSNPLRAWRHAQTPRVTALDAAARLRVGGSMVQQYERGAARPGPAVSERLDVLLGPGWRDRWTAWLDAQPS